MNQERPFSPREPEFAVIGMAQMFTGVNYSNNRHGLIEARAALVAQHEKVMPPARAKVVLQQVVAQKNPLIRVTEQMASLALTAHDYETALATANHLHAYGEMDYEDSLGGEAFNLSLRTHRALAERIRDRFSGRDPYLRMAGRQMFTEIGQLRRQGDFSKELGLLRGLIHTVALNGTLGEEAKQMFDPFALVSI